MKLRIIIILSFFFLSILKAYAFENPPFKNIAAHPEPKKYKEITFLDQDKKGLKLSEFNSNFHILNFWATWCAPCKKEMPSLDELNKTKDFISKNKLSDGILNINILHTSASLTIQENADPDVLYDLIKFFKKLVPMDNKLYKHTIEGKDDMPAHIKSALTNSHLTLSVKEKKIILGKWQALYLFEHRLENQARKVSHHFIGE